MIGLFYIKINKELIFKVILLIFRFNFSDMGTVYYKSPVGILEIKEENGFIVSLEIFQQISLENKPVSTNNPILIKVLKQLDEYFAGKRFNFDIPLKQDGTAFQQKAWNFLKTIPYGETVSYKTEAEAVGNPKSSRAIGSANGANNIAIIIPCHRVINANGKLGGYAYGIDVKEKLLDMEKKFRQQEVK